MQKTKRQHTVPRCYLERWLNQGGNIATFDKITRKAYDTSVWNVAQERFFYDLHPEAIKPEYRDTGIDLQAIEKGLAAIEGYFARALDSLLGEGEPRGIHPSLRWMLAIQVAIQWMRTKRCRDVMLELTEKTMQAHADELVRRNFPDLPKARYPTVTLKEHSVSVLHNQFFFDRDRWEKIAGVLVNHIWMLVVNESSSPFFTWDQPVVRRANQADDNTGGIGIDSPGVEFFMPVSPKHGIVMLGKTVFRDWEMYDGGLAAVGLEKVEQLNRLQVEQSHRHIFSSTNDFATAQRTCVENPGICDPDRPTVEITVKQTGPMKTRFETRVRY